MNLEPDLEAIEEVMAPYVVERMPTDTDTWRGRVSALERKWRWRLLKRKLLGWMPKGRRDQSAIRGEYERIWADGSIPGTSENPTTRPVPAEWRGEGLMVRRGALPRVHLLFMARAIEALNPRTVLEVGAGDGRNLFALSARFPHIDWHGVELTNSGVQRAQAVQKEDALPEGITSYFPWPVEDPEAFRRIEFKVGNATALPHPDQSFDLVMTHLALEQMEQVRDQALTEIARVSKGDVLLLEPFADFNATPLRRNAVKAIDYLSLPVAALEQFGIEPCQVTDAFPQKVRLGNGLVVGRLRG